MVKHIVVEDYEHYVRRKRNKLKFWIPVIIIVSLIMIFFILKDFKKSYPQEPQENFIKFPELYNSCIESCSGVYSEGEEMTKACDLAEETISKPHSIFIQEDCFYKGLVHACNCMKQGEKEEDCQAKMTEYLKEIGCES